MCVYLPASRSKPSKASGLLLVVVDDGLRVLSWSNASSIVEWAPLVPAWEVGVGFASHGDDCGLVALGAGAQGSVC